MAKRARDRGKAQSQGIEFWFRRKYGLTIHDPRYLAASREDMLTDWWAYQYLENPNLDSQAVVDDDFDQDEIIRKLEEDPDSDDFDWESLTS